MVLRFVEGYRLEEVATLTGRSTGAVKALQHRALRHLRATFLEVKL
jgi:DNA-directed RNA polymerase specialized sigma24 family protein